MLLNPNVATARPLSDDATRLGPFTLRLIEPDNQVFHILDDITLPVILRECDTISDFVEYLDMKERMTRSGKLLSTAGEEELVGMFLGVRASLPDIIESRGKIAGIALLGGIYADILQRPDYQAYVRENQSSYFWDYLIANHCEGVLSGKLIPGSVRSIAGNEAMLRILASESRVNRRFLADAYLDLMANGPRGEVTSRTVVWPPETVYVFQVHPRVKREYALYRRERQEYLHRYCFLTGWRNQGQKRVVGLATDGAHPLADGYDLAILEFEKWTPEMIAAGARLNQEMAVDVSRPLTLRQMDPRFVTGWVGSTKSANRRSEHIGKKNGSKTKKRNKRKRR